MILSHSIAKTIIKNNIKIDVVIDVLRKYKLLSLLIPIKRHLEKLEKMESTEGTLRIESPFMVSPESLTRILEITDGKNAHHEVVINKDILAGFKARYKGKLYDGSAERIIKQLTN